MSGFLVVENVSYEAGGIKYLQDISFSVERGENVVFFGPENSGLHLLCSLLMGFINATEGDIRYNGSSINKLDYIGRHNYKKEIGYLHQNYGLISNMTAEENISLPLQYHSQMSNDEIRNYVKRILYDLNLESCKSFRPVDLSNSEILRTAYARATVLDPGLLLIEHAFEGQSPMNLLSFMDVLKKRLEKNDKAVLFITYQPEYFLDVADRFFMLFNGRMVFSGAPDEYLNSDNPYLNQYKNLTSEGPMVFL